MKYYGKAEESVKKIVKAFQSGMLPKVVAFTYLKLDGVEKPSYKWSFLNRLIIALDGHDDARGFKQWQAVGRTVKAGEKASHILAPIFAKVEDKKTGEDKSILIGFKSIPVFGASQTEGEPLPEDNIADQLKAKLPLVDVAEHWNMTITVHQSKAGEAGHYIPSRNLISMACEDASVFLHELVHKADDICQGGLKGGQDMIQEVVAEMGAAVLMDMLGMRTDETTGQAWAYIEAYCQRDGKAVDSVCMSLVKRIGMAVDCIMTVADEVSGKAQAA